MSNSTAETAPALTAAEARSAGSAGPVVAIVLIVLSKMNAAQQQFNNQFQNFQQNSGFQSPSTTFCTNLQGIATSC